MKSESDDEDQEGSSGEKSQRSLKDSQEYNSEEKSDTGEDMSQVDTPIALNGDMATHSRDLVFESLKKNRRESIVQFEKALFMNPLVR